MFTPFSALTSKVYGALAIGALVVAGAQTLRIEGAFCRDTAAGEYSRCVFTGFRQDVADRDLKIENLTVKLFAEQMAHRQTKLDYRAAQDEAERLDAARIVRVQGQQQEITNEVVADYQARLADARARAEQLRGELAATGERAPGPGGGDKLPATGDAAGRAPEATGDRGLSIDERLIATEQALQLNALIDWVTAQAGVDTGR